MANRAEKMFLWSADSIRWYEQAARCHDYHLQLARRILERLPSGARVCDMGCGLGYLSLALSAGARSVLAVDCKAQALAVLRRNVRAAGIQNVEALEGDFERLPDPKQPFDGMVFSLFGSLWDFYERACRWSGDRIFYIMNAASKRTFSAAKQKNPGARPQAIAEFLQGKGATYTLDWLELPLGQPFESYADALRFMQHYDGESTLEQRRAFLERNLLPYDRPGFPLYLPNDKRLAMFTIRCAR